MPPSAPDWLEFSRRAEAGARSALARFPDTVQRSERIGRGEGGDMTLAIDKAVEDSVFDSIEELGESVRVVSEERGEVDIRGGGPVRIVVDPIDGSLNAKRRLPPYSLSIAVAEGDTMDTVEFGFVSDLAGGQAWWAERGAGASMRAPTTRSCAGCWRCAVEQRRLRVIVAIVARLRRVDCSDPGIRRRRRGRGFEYLDNRGRRIVDDDVLERIAELAIPPAWRDVWICSHATGHLQATGLDARGRKQYLYHPKWRERRDRQKFDDMLAFARTLPDMRTAVADALGAGGLGRERILACSVRLLDRGFFRVGGEDYAAENDSYGLATIQKRPVRLLPGGTLRFDYPAKSGQRRVQSIVDPDVFEVVDRLKRRRGGGDELLAYKERGRWRDIRSDDINAYVKQVAGGDFSAKDFRTWNATVIAAVGLAVSGPQARGSKTARRRAVTRTIKEVAHYLGNTPAVARASYVDPRIFDRFDAGYTIGGALEQIGTDGDIAALHGPV